VVVAGLDGKAQFSFLVTIPSMVNTYAELWAEPWALLDAEVDQLLSLVGGFKSSHHTPAETIDSTPVNDSVSHRVNGYVKQNLRAIVRVSKRQSASSYGNGNRATV